MKMYRFVIDAIFIYFTILPSEDGTVNPSSKYRVGLIKYTILKSSAICTKVIFAFAILKICLKITGEEDCLLN